MDKTRGPLMLLASSRKFRRWTAGLLIGVPLIYVASFGPACWWFAASAREVPGGPAIGNDAAVVSRAYWPIGWILDRYRSLRPVFTWYSRLFGVRSAVIVPVTGRSAQGTLLWSRSTGSVPIEAD